MKVTNFSLAFYSPQKNALYPPTSSWLLQQPLNKLSNSSELQIKRGSRWYVWYIFHQKEKRSKRKIKLEAVYSCKDSEEGVREFDVVSSESACLDESSVASFVSDCWSLSDDCFDGDVSACWTGDILLGVLRRDASNTERVGEGKA